MVELEKEEFCVAEDESEARRQYITSSLKIRLHQKSFRERVLKAYQNQCSICRLRHTELLEAAHILPDKHPLGEPIISNGLALCKLHHAAYDKNILGITPDHEIQIRKDILEEIDGPMLLHGLQGFQGCKISTPRASKLKPNPVFLEERYRFFIEAH
jgi:putative restriction endonuclease